MKFKAFIVVTLWICYMTRVDGTNCAGSSRGPLQEFIPFCRWYSLSACCTTLDIIEETSSEIFEIESHYSAGNNSCGSVSLECASVLELTVCGIKCSPNQGLFVSNDLVTATICPTLSTRLYSACKEFQENVNGVCRRIGDIYPTSTAFASSLGLTVATTTTTSGKCFSFAISNGFSFYVSFLCFVLLMIAK